MLMHPLPDVNISVPTSAPIQDPKWTPVPKVKLGQVDTNQQGTQSFGLREIIPQAAREVLLYVNLQVGDSDPHDVSDDIKIFTADGSNEYAKYMAIHTYHQNAWVTNSSNMWLPITEKREISVVLPRSYKTGRFDDNHVHLILSVIGYR